MTDRTGEVPRSIITWLLWLKGRRAFRSAARWNVSAITRGVSFGVLVLLFWGITYLGVSRLCTRLTANELAGPILLGRFFSLGFLAVFILSLISHVFTAYSSLFGQAELHLIHTSPARPQSIFRTQVFEALLRGTWMIALICLPILAAYGRTLGAPWYYYPLSVSGLIPFLLIGGAAGAGIALTVARFFAGRPARLQFLGAIMVGLAIGLFWFGSSIIERFVNEPNPEDLAAELASMQLSTNAFLPHLWMKELLDAGVAKRPIDIALCFTLLTTTAWLGLVLVSLFGDRVYMKSWLHVQDRSQAHNRPAWQRLKGIDRITHPLPAWFASLLRRDARLFLRDAGQWSQFIILFCLVLVYMFHVHNVSQSPNLERYKLLIVPVNVVLIGFVQATLALRYAFPSISAEGRAIWSVLESPLGVERYLLTKLIEQLTWILSFGLGMTLLLNYLLEIPAPVSYLGVLLAVLFSIGFAACTVGLGACFARFDTTNVTEISSGAGALVTAVVTIFYLALSVAILVQIVLLGSAKSFGVGGLLGIQDPRVFLMIGIFVLVQLAAVFYPLHLGAKVLREV